MPGHTPHKDLRTSHAGDYGLGVEWGTKLGEQRYSEELTQLKRSETTASCANKALMAIAAENDARLKEES